MTIEPQFGILTIEHPKDLEFELEKASIFDFDSNLILECTSWNIPDFEAHIELLNKINVYLLELNKSFVIVHPAEDGNQFEPLVVIPTLHEAKEFVIMDELMRQIN